MNYNLIKLSSFSKLVCASILAFALYQFAAPAFLADAQGNVNQQVQIVKEVLTGLGLSAPVDTTVNQAAGLVLISKSPEQVSGGGSQTVVIVQATTKKPENYPTMLGALRTRVGREGLGVRLYPGGNLMTSERTAESVTLVPNVPALIALHDTPFAQIAPANAYPIGIASGIFHCENLIVEAHRVKVGAQSTADMSIPDVAPTGLKLRTAAKAELLDLAQKLTDGLLGKRACSTSPSTPPEPPATKAAAAKGFSVGGGCATYPQGQVVCAATTSNAPPNAVIRFEWVVDGQTIANQTGRELNLQDQTKGAHTVIVVAIDTNSNSRTAPLTLTFNVTDGPEPSSKPTGNLALNLSCASSAASLDCAATPLNAPADADLVYTWSLDGVAQKGNTRSLSVPSPSDGPHFVSVWAKDNVSGKVTPANATVVMVGDPAQTSINVLLTGQTNPDPVDLAMAAAASTVVAIGLGALAVLNNLAPSAGPSSGGGDSPPSQSPSAPDSPGLQPPKPTTLPEASSVSGANVQPPPSTPPPKVKPPALSGTIAAPTKPSQPATESGGLSHLNPVIEDVNLVIEAANQIQPQTPPSKGEPPKTVRPKEGSTKDEGEPDDFSKRLVDEIAKPTEGELDELWGRWGKLLDQKEHAERDARWAEKRLAEGGEDARRSLKKAVEELAAVSKAMDKLREEHPELFK